MNRRKLGKQGLEVAELGLGCMGMSEFYGPADEGEAIATVHRGLGLGITFLDTVDYLLQPQPRAERRGREFRGRPPVGLRFGEGPAMGDLRALPPLEPVAAGGAVGGALEACDLWFRDTRLRFCTKNIGLARLREGLELVRIGKPLRPEFAAWRYGRQFLRRRVRRLLRATAQGVGYTLTSFVGMFFFWRSSRPLRRKAGCFGCLNGRMRSECSSARHGAAAPELVGQTRLTRMNAETRLVLEMAAHEESERRAMEGELRELEAAWREAEVVAAIADRLLIPESVEPWIRRHRSRGL